MKAQKNLYPAAGKAATLAACLLMFSCSSDDLDNIRKTTQGGSISFSIPAAGKAAAKGTSLSGSPETAGEYTAARFVMRSPDTDDTLCVQTVISDGINVTSFEGGTAATRGVPVTSLETYGSFHVQAHCTDNGTPVSQFYMDDNATNSDGTVWSTSQVRYWPGENRTLQFFAWAPVDAAFTATPGSPESTTLEYTVPTTVTDQKDVVVATTEEIAGNANTTQPLAFRHICTAVKFKVGDQMQAGTIKKITISGVHNSGAYDMASDSWQLGSNTTAFSIEQDIEMTGNESGSMITDGENTFMMLPQELPAGAKVEIIFHDSQAGTDRTFSASIGGMTWPQGKTVTYSLSITPEYELEFISEPELQDAHYIIYPIHIKAGDVPGGWTITSSDPNNVTLRTDLTILTRRGFWIEEDKGTASIRSTAQGDDITIYAFLTENAGEENRKITLEMRPTNLPDVAPQTFTIEQLCPSWNGNLGCERLEEYDEGFTGYPWGFKWDSNMKITYDFGGIFSGWDNGIYKIVSFVYINLFSNYPWVSDETNWATHYLVHFDFSKISPLNVAIDPDDGRKNTLEIYNFQGLNDASSFMQTLKEWGIEADKELELNPTVFAARTAAMKNKFNKRTEEKDGENVEVAYLKEENMVWYLPAQNQAPLMKDANYPLSGEYWTSTALIGNDNSHAYKYTVGGSTSTEDRNTSLHVRAVRSK